MKKNYSTGLYLPESSTPLSESTPHATQNSTSERAGSAPPDSIPVPPPSPQHSPWFAFNSLAQNVRSLRKGPWSLLLIAFLIGCLTTKYLPGWQELFGVSRNVAALLVMHTNVIARLSEEKHVLVASNRNLQASDQQKQDKLSAKEVELARKEEQLKAAGERLTDALAAEKTQRADRDYWYHECQDWHKAETAWYQRDEFRTAGAGKALSDARRIRNQLAELALSREKSKGGMMRNAARSMVSLVGLRPDESNVDESSRAITEQIDEMIRELEALIKIERLLRHERPRDQRL